MLSIEAWRIDNRNSRQIITVGVLLRDYPAVAYVAQPRAGARGSVEQQQLIQLLGVLQRKLKCNLAAVGDAHDGDLFHSECQYELVHDLDLYGLSVLRFSAHAL
ncbi:hypothetical protein SDC9_208592 [bioreactor metagenome]|uniref:Uncharacterized protein n=1 Tax=bioreactor metagenome TaxID=1076179 RepID=A0A645JDV6_9ZZZZ